VRTLAEDMLDGEEIGQGEAASYSDPANQGFEWNKRYGGWLNVKCGENLQVARIRLPWETTNSRVQRAKTEAECRACGEELMRRDILQTGWQCRRGWFRRFSLYRQADVALGPTAPLHAFNLTEADAANASLPLPPGRAPLPKSLRGVFWLGGQKDRSALLTFAKNDGTDCKWCSTGKLIGNGYRIRPLGSCSWAFANVEGFWNPGYSWASNMMLVYDWFFDDPVNPTFAHMGPVVGALPWNSGGLLAKQRWWLSFDMALQSAEQAEEKGYNGSVFWSRSTYLFKAWRFSHYDLVQVVDEDGNRIEPAWSKFVAYQESASAGKSPGILYHHGCQ